MQGESWAAMGGNIRGKLYSQWLNERVQWEFTIHATLWSLWEIQRQVTFGKWYKGVTIDFCKLNPKELLTCPYHFRVQNVLFWPGECVFWCCRVASYEHHGQGQRLCWIRIIPSSTTFHLFSTYAMRRMLILDQKLYSEFQLSLMTETATRVRLGDVLGLPSWVLASSLYWSPKLLSAVLLQTVTFLSSRLSLCFLLT